MMKALARAAIVATIVGTALRPTFGQSSYIQNTNLIGRFLVDGSRAAFEWPGSAIEVRFNGSALHLVITDTGSNSMVVELDGKTSRIDLKNGRHEYKIAASETAGPHVVRFIRRTEAMLGETVLEDIRTDGQLLPKEERTRSLLVIGDSISTGYGVEGKDTKCSFSADTENQYLTFAAVAARSFDADVISLAFSGKGLARNYDGSTSSTMMDLYGQLLPLRNITAPLPQTDVIIVHLGTNDYAGGARPADFVSRYLDLLTTLRSSSPNAYIYVGIGPMLAGADLETALDSIDEVVTTRKKAGDKSVGRIQFTDPPAGASRGCDWHPNEAGQLFMAEQLEKRIQADLGW